MDGKVTDITSSGRNHGFYIELLIPESAVDALPDGLMHFETYRKVPNF